MKESVSFFSTADLTYSWKKLPGNLMQIDNGLTTEVWGIDRYHRIFRWDRNTSKFENVFGLFKHVSVG